MLEAKQPSNLSPLAPHNMECFGGLWEQDVLPLPSKVETADMMDTYGMDNNVSSTIHHLGNHYPQIPNSQYLTPLGDPYCSSECQYNLDAFPIEGSINSAFHKFSDVQSSMFPDSYDKLSYDTYLPDLPLPSQHAPNGMVHGLVSLPFSDPNGAIHPPSTHSEYNWDDLQCDQEYSYIRKPDYILNSEIDSELDSKSSGESHSTLTDSSYTVTPPKRKVGRPPKKDKKLKRNEKKTGRLWEFIRDLLKNPDYCPNFIKWENSDEGLFRFVNSEKVAQLWGHIKGNPRMTYEKLSRAMRYYYKSHVFEPVLGRRLVYKFGFNATGWRPHQLAASHHTKLYN